MVILNRNTYRNSLTLSPKTTKTMLFLIVIIAMSGFGTAKQEFTPDNLPHNDEASSDDTFTQLIDRMKFFEERLSTQEKEIAHLKDKHSVDLLNIRKDYESKISALNVLHEDEMNTLHKMVEEMVRSQDDLQTNSAGEPKVVDIDGYTSTWTADGHDDEPLKTNQAVWKSKRTGIDTGKQRKRRSENDLNISFFAKIVQNVHHLGQNQNVIFDTVVTNNGNAYNHYVGAFIAPVDGTYMFSTTLVTYNSDTSHYGIYVNDNRTTILYVNGEDNTSDSTSQTVVFQLRELDTVTVKHLDSDKALVGYHHSLFSGFLIAEDYTGSSSIIGK